MPVLVNGPLDNSGRLIDYIAKATQDTTERNGKRILYILACYFDLKSIKMIISRTKGSLKNVQGKLIEVHILVDASDWIKRRISREEINSIICKSSDLPPDSISFTPINIPNKLLHAKVYGVVSKSKSKIGKRRGFIAITSGNLTQRGLGFDEQSNVEAVEIIKKQSSINEFVEIIKEIRTNYFADENKHNKFLLTLRILSLGYFYHRWDGNLGSNVRFKLTLTEKGKNAQKRDNQLFPNYTKDSNTISRDPLNLSQIFEVVPKPFPERFWATYSIDTLVGRWVPIHISEFVDKLLENETKPYIKQIKRLSTPKKLDKIVDELTNELLQYKKNGYIKDNRDAITIWRDRIKDFRINSNLIESCIFNYEKVPDLLDNLDRRTILQCYQSLNIRLSMKQAKGLRAIIDRAINNGAIDLERELNILTQKAAKSLSVGNEE